MARVTCRCGETLKVSSSDPDRVNCPRCGAKIRVRRSPSQRPGASALEDGYVRFHCVCGRRLKVRSAERPEAGKCPDCGRIVPVPESAWPVSGGSSAVLNASVKTPPNTRTADMDAVDLERLERWASRHQEAANQNPQPGGDTTTSHPSLGVISSATSTQQGESSGIKTEAGLRVCPGCGKPLHMSATVCRSCGEPVPRR